MRDGPRRCDGGARADYNRSAPDSTLTTAPPAEPTAPLPVQPLRPPWERPELFSPRPADPPFGYIVRGVRQGCTREELVARCRAGVPHVDLVWVPEYPRLLPPAEVPWLLDAVRRRLEENLRYNVKNGLGQLLIWTVAGVALRMPPPLLAIIVTMMGVLPVVQPLWGLWRLRRDPDGYAREQAGILRYQMWLGTRRATATVALGACLVLVGLAQLYAGIDPGIGAAGLVKPLVREGQAWRLLTAPLLHGHLIHFAFNFFALMALGRLIEMHGHPLYLPTVFLFSALCGGVMSFYFTEATSVGASGGILGMVGFLAVIGLRRRHVVPRGFLKSMAVSVALTAGTGLVAHQYIDNAAHAGGFLGGLMLGAVYVTRRQSRPDSLRLTPSPLAKLAGFVSAGAIVATTVATVVVVLLSRR